MWPVTNDVAGLIVGYGLDVADMLSLLQTSRTCWPLVWASMPHLVRLSQEVRPYEDALGSKERSVALSKVWNPQGRCAVPGSTFRLEGVCSVALGEGRSLPQETNVDEWMSAYAIQRKMCLRTIYLMMHWRRRELNDVATYMEKAMTGRREWYGECLGEVYHVWVQTVKESSWQQEARLKITSSLSSSAVLGSVQPVFKRTCISCTLENVSILWNGHNTWWHAEWNRPQNPIVPHDEFVGGRYWSGCDHQWIGFPNGIREWKDGPCESYPGPARAIVALCGKSAEIRGIIDAHIGGFVVVGRGAMVIVLREET